MTGAVFSTFACFLLWHFVLLLPQKPTILVIGRRMVQELKQQLWLFDSQSYPLFESVACLCRHLPLLFVAAPDVAPSAVACRPSDVADCVDVFNCSW